MTKLNLHPATGGELKQLAGAASDASEKVIREFGLSKKDAQRVRRRDDEFAAAISHATIAALRDLSVTEKFKDEEVESSYGYLGYQPKDVSEQVNILRELFPELGERNIRFAEREPPNGMESYFAIPRWQKIAKTYQEAILKVFTQLKKQRQGKFHNYLDGQLGPDRLRQSARSVATWKKLGAGQKGDILVIPAEFGIRHRGQSTRRARAVMDGSDEFGLGVFAVGIMLLTHPQRLKLYALLIDCAGDECHDPQDSVPFGRVPYFGYDGGDLEFATHRADHINVEYGSASGWFVPQA
jgi:hypothetical protein